MDNVNFGSFQFRVARPGTKVSTSSRPEFTLTPTFNKFSLNPIASQKLDLEAGDHVTIIVNDSATNVNEMYFLAKGIGEESQSKLASVGNKSGTGRLLNFSYSGVYSRMIQQKVGALEVSAEGLAEMDLMVKRDTAGGNVAYSALRKVHYEIGEPMEVEIDEVDTTLYPLVNAKVSTYDPRTEAE